MSDKHPIFNRTVLWPILLASTALCVPLVLAKSIPPQPQTVTSSSPSSPLVEPSPQPSQEDFSVEREWQRRLVSQGLTWPKSSNTPTSTVASKSTASKTETQPSKSAVAKTETSPSKSAVAKTNTSPSAKSKAQNQSTQLSKASQPHSQPQGSTITKEQVPHHVHTGPILEMRVAIANGDSSLVVGSSTPAEVVDAQGKSIGKLPANEGTNVLPNGQYLRLGDWQTPAGVWVKPTKGGFVFVNNNWYRGDVLLVTQGNSLLAVNYVDLEDYIASVVGAEVSPSWPMDALKAQAIAARSYAIVHYIRPASSLYDLGNTERWQVYRGISAEWNTTRQAVHETSGVFLSYKGGVVESLYAASDDIVVNVFGGRGMSQNGALSLAEKGYNYRQILGNYYPGTSLAWLDTKQHDAD